MTSVSKLVDYLVENRDTLGLKLLEDKDLLLIDAGVNVRPGIVVGRYLSEICLCGLGEVQIHLERVGELVLPKVRVVTDYPHITLLSQYAAWVVKSDNDVLYLSGPGRIIARKPKKIFESLCKLGLPVPHISDPVLICECARVPGSEALSKIAESLGASKQLTIFLTSNKCYAGVVQTCARVLEVCMLRLYQLGFNIAHVKSGLGCVVAPPPLDRPLEASALCNDSILYTGQVLLIMDLNTLEDHGEIFRKAVRENRYSFMDYVKAHGEEFLVKIDPDMFRIAELTVVNHEGYLRKYGTLDVNTFLSLILKLR